MCFQVRGVDHDALGLGTFTGQRRKDAVEDAKLAPANETVIERLVWPVIFWRILPLQAMLDDIDNAADDTAIINARNTMGQGKIRRGSEPSGARSAETNHSSRSPSRNRESHLISNE